MHRLGGVALPVDVALAAAAARRAIAAARHRRMRRHRAVRALRCVLREPCAPRPRNNRLSHAYESPAATNRAMSSLCRAPCCHLVRAGCCSDPLHFGCFKRDNKQWAECLPYAHMGTDSVSGLCVDGNGWQCPTTWLTPSPRSNGGRNLLQCAATKVFSCVCHSPSYKHMHWRQRDRD